MGRKLFFGIGIIGAIASAIAVQSFERRYNYLQSFVFANAHKKRFAQAWSNECKPKGFHSNACLRNRLKEDITIFNHSFSLTLIKKGSPKRGRMREKSFQDFSLKRLLAQSFERRCDLDV